MSNNLAKIISYLLIPQINLIFAFVVLSVNVYSDFHSILISMLIALIFGLIIPIIVVVYLRKKGKISDNNASIKEERTFPYMIGIGLALNALIIALIFKLHALIVALWFAYVVIQVAMLIINYYWKISAHLIGIAIPIAVFFFLYQFDMIYLLIIPILLAWARLTLKFHTIMQLVVGFLLGAIPTYYILYESIRHFS